MKHSKIRDLFKTCLAARLEQIGIKEGSHGIFLKQVPYLGMDVYAQDICQLQRQDIDGSIF